MRSCHRLGVPMHCVASWSTLPNRYIMRRRQILVQNEAPCVSLATLAPTLPCSRSGGRPDKDSGRVRETIGVRAVVCGKTVRRHIAGAIDGMPLRACHPSRRCVFAVSIANHHGRPSGDVVGCLAARQSHRLWPRGHRSGAGSAASRDAPRRSCGAGRCRSCRPCVPEPIYWKQQLFLIPYQWGAAAQTQAARSVSLFLSKDRGVSWQKISDARPDVRSFNYRAEGDGEYWFAVRTLDQYNRWLPEGPYKAELRVIVDTTIPKIDELRASAAADAPSTSSAAPRT